MPDKLIEFLRSELNISNGAISLARKAQNVEPNILPIILWQYGLLDINQLDLVFEWLEIS